MTATDELRRLLDERGVEWGAEESELDHVTTWNANGGQSMFYESKTTNPNLLQVNYYDLTPEQAVEATLGRGEVERLQDENGRLRSCLSDSAENAKQIMHEAHVQEAENAKLLELVKSMYYDLSHQTFPPDWVTDYAADMRELGVEVDG